MLARMLGTSFEAPDPSRPGIPSEAAMSVESPAQPAAIATAGAPDVLLPPLPPHWRSLPRAFVHAAREYWSREAMTDSTKASASYGMALTRALALGRVLARTLGPEPYVGVMVPPSVPAAVTNLALLLIGKIPINLNYTASQTVIDAAVRQCGLRHTITSHKVVERAKLTPEGALLYLEDFPEQVTKLDKAWAALVARFAPIAAMGSFLPGLKADNLDATATIIFTSGSTGDPKGVLLSHRNILSNVHQVNTHLRLLPEEVVLGILPMFHSFGFTVTIWTVLLLGKKAVYHFNPLDSKIVCDLVEKHKVTMLVGTPTFMRHYAQKAKPGQLSTLHHLLLGAEKLKPELAKEIVEKTGVTPLEGYGTTELSPTVAVNAPFAMTLPDGRTVDGNRPGTVGRVLPGTAIRTIGIEEGETLPRGTEGMIQVKGPQVMVGYLDRPEATAKVLVDGWYTTGDIGYHDADGFLHITDRLSRFSKIGGEMVPHVGIESALMKAAGVDESAVAVTSVPDAKRGERLVVLHTPWDISPAEACRRLAEAQVPRLWIPGVDDFVAIEAIPILGTGKVDLRKLREIAAEATR